MCGLLNCQLHRVHVCTYTCIYKVVNINILSTHVHNYTNPVLKPAEPSQLHKSCYKNLLNQLSMEHTGQLFWQTHISSELSDGHAQWVFTPALCQPQQSREETSWAHGFLHEEEDSHHLRSAIGEGACLVKYYHLHLRPHVHTCMYTYGELLSNRSV